MLDVKLIRREPEIIRRTLLKRGLSDDILEDFLITDKEYRALLKQIEDIRHKRKELSKKIKEDSSIREVLIQLKEQEKKLEEDMKEKEKKTRQILLKFPNLLHDSVPEGHNPNYNQQIRKWKDIPEFDFEVLPHWEIAKRLDIIDTERAVKVAGARFPLYKNLGAKLERALIWFMLDLHTKEHNYIEILPPFLASTDSMEGCGQLPRFKNELYKSDSDELYLIPTGEISLTSMHKGEILKEEELPLLYVAYTPCFRREAGSYGKDTKGLIRQHQFNKVELVKFTTPETSFEELEKLTQDAEEVLKRLDLPYRVVNLCSGDIGYCAAKCYDIEVWLPSQRKYVEISSCSNILDYQARRLNIRFRRKENNQLEYLHTLNGSGVAIGRCMAAILENYQTKDNTVIIPEVLRKYMDGIDTIKKE